MGWVAVLLWAILVICIITCVAVVWMIAVVLREGYMRRTYCGPIERRHTLNRKQQREVIGKFVGELSLVNTPDDLRRLRE